MVALSVSSLLSPMMLATHHSNGRWKPAKHFGVIDYEFRSLLNTKEYEILVIKSAPRHGKSQYISRWGASWFHLTHPYDCSMLCTYSALLAKEHSQWCRDTVHRLAPLFGLRGVDPGSSAKADWKLAETMGGMLATGVDGSQTGRGAKLIMIDDYVKNAKEANSEGRRDSVWEWFRSTISTRREPGGKIVVLSTQWHEDDLIGRLKKYRDDIGLKVRFVTLSAICEDNGRPDPIGRLPGEALWPERWPIEELVKARALLGEYWFSCQYQGNPKPRQGRMFKWLEEHFIKDTQLPDEFDGLVRYWDRAGTEGGGCMTCGVLMGRHGNMFYIIDVVREQLGGEDVQELIAKTARSDNAAYGLRVKTMFEREGNASGKLVASLTEKMLAEYRVQGVDPKGDKEFRAEPLATAVKNNMVRVVKGKEWSVKFTDSVAQFPNGKYKDDTDAASGAYAELYQIKPVEMPAASFPNAVVPGGGNKTCRSPGCKRPAFDGEYCCDVCKAGAGVHTPKCYTAYNDYAVRRPPPKEHR